MIHAIKYPFRCSYTATFFIWPVLPLPHPDLHELDRESSCSLRFLSLVSSLGLSPSPNPNPRKAAARASRRRRRRRVGSTWRRLCRRGRRLRRTRIQQRRSKIQQDAAQVCTSIRVHGRGLSKMVGFLATGDPCGSSSSTMVGNKAR